LAAFLLATRSLFAQADETSRRWNKPVAPFRIAGNLYYVGAIEITSYLITTSEGHFLLDGGFVETAPQIEHNIAELGFKLTDVKFLLNSHAHYDHAGGLAELKKVTGAKFLASEGDAPLLRSGGMAIFASAIPSLFRRSHPIKSSTTEKRSGLAIKWWLHT